MKGEWYEVLDCLHPERTRAAWRAGESSTCDLPPDDFPEAGDPSCPNCRGRHGCSEPAHGTEYVGLPGAGFRTSRCPASWASEPFALGVMQAHGWTDTQAFSSAFPRPSAILLDALAFLRREMAARRAHEFEQRREDS